MMKGKRRIVICLVLLIVAGMASMSMAEEDRQKVLIAATDYPPYEFEHPEGDLRGFDVEVVEEAFRRLGIEATFEFYPWARALEMTKAGEATAALSCARGAPEREEFMLFSEPISHATGIFLVRKDYDGPPLSQYEDVQRFQLDTGIVRGEFLAKILDERGIPYDESPSFDIVLQKLADGRIDTNMTTQEFAQYQLLTLNMRDRFEWFERETVTNDFHLCFSKQWPNVEELRQRFDDALKTVKEDGTYDAIHNKYR